MFAPVAERMWPDEINLPKMSSPKSIPPNTAKKYPTFIVITIIILKTVLDRIDFGRHTRGN